MLQFLHCRSQLRSRTWMYAVCPINDDSEKVKDLLSARDTAGRKLVFSFKGGHVFQGEYRTTPTQTIEANVWQSKYSASEQFVREPALPEDVLEQQKRVSAIFQLVRDAAA